MKKYLLFLTLLLAFCLPRVANAQETLTVYDGTTQNNVIPAYIYYFDDFARSQFVIPASDLSEMAGASISSVKFYTTSSNVPYTTVSTVDVYVMEVNYTTMTGLEPKSNGTIVYQGTLDVVTDGSGGSLTIEFEDSYTYNGGNLLIGIENTTDAGYKSIYFYGQTVTGAAWGGSNGSSLDNVTGSVKDFIPKTTFTYTLPSTGCDDLTSLTATANGHDVTLNWTGGSGTYTIQYKKTTADEWTTYQTAQTFANNTVNIPNLDANTAYQARVQSVCGANTSNWKYVNFSTPIVCPAPTALNFTLTPGNGSVAALNWTENGQATQWQICLDGDENNLITVSQNPYTLTGLTAETQYTAKVRAYCDQIDQSTWSNTVTFTPTDAYSITVNNGTNTNNVVPIYGLWVDDYSYSQFIIPAADLSDMQYGTIDKMTFYAAADKNWGAAQFEVYVSEVNNTTLDALVDWTTMEKVMNAASLSISGNQMEVNLDYPYQYMGGNLMIGFKQTVSGTYSGCSWYGISAPGASFGGNGSSLSQQNFLPKTTFDFTPGQAPACPKPTQLTVNYTGGTTATVTWDGTADSYNLYVNEEPLEGVTSPYVLDNLDLATTYTLQVEAVCGNTTSDLSTPASFTTDLCLPANQCEINIELTDAYGDGGGKIQVVDVLTNEVLGTYTNSGSSSTYTLNVCSGRDVNFVFASTDSWAYENGYVITDADGEVIAEHEGCSSSGSCSAPANGVITTYTVSCSACKKPANLTYDITSTGATITWVENGSATSWQVTLGDNNPVTVNETTYTFTDLTPSTEYSVSVVALCDGENSDPLTDSFITDVACPAPNVSVETEATTAELTITGEAEAYNLRYRTPRGFHYNFEQAEAWTYDNFTPCTTYDGDETQCYAFDGSTFTNFPFTGSTFAFGSQGGNLSSHNGDIFGLMVCPADMSPADDWFILPEITIEDGYIFSFWGREITTQYGDEIINVGVYGTQEGTFASLLAENVAINTTTYTQYSYDLSAYAGQTIKLAINYVSTDIFGFMFDDIFVGDPTDDTWDYTFNNVTSPYEITGLEPQTEYEAQVQSACGSDGTSEWTSINFTTLPACLVPTGLNVDNITTESAVVTWVSDAPLFDIEVNGTVTEDVTSPYTLSNLEENNVYTIRVLAKCDATTLSAWTSAYSFRTPCSAFDLPYEYGFDDVATADNPEVACWTYGSFNTTNSVGFVWRDQDAGDVAFRFSSYTSTSDDYTQVLISPELSTTNTDLVVEFEYMKYSTSETFNVGYSTTTNDLSEFTWLDEDIVASSTEWATFNSEDLGITIPAGTKYVAVLYTSQYQYYLFVDNFSFTEAPDCTKPSTLAADNITFQGATISWTENGSATAWEVAYRENGTEDWSANISVTTDPTYTFSGLDPETTYDVRVRAVCSTEPSNWLTEEAAFTTSVACPAPSAPQVLEVTNNSVTVGWTENGDASEWEVTVEALGQSYTMPVTENPITVPGLPDATEISASVTVKAICDNGYESQPVTATLTFTTLANCPAPTLNEVAQNTITATGATLTWTAGGDANESYNVEYRLPAYVLGLGENFGTSLPSGWAMYTGLLDNVMAGTADLTSNTYAWSFGTGNGVFDQHARVNIWGTNCQNWLVSPAVTIPQGGMLDFDMALTVWSSSSSASPTAGAQADDKFVVLASTDEGSTWTILRQWDNAGSEYVYDEITNTGDDHVSIDLSNFVGSAVNIAFYGESTVSGGDNNLHIDNVVIGLPIPATEWTTAATSVTGTEYVLTGLVQETTYEVRIIANCDGDDVSESNIESFTTEPACHNIENPYYVTGSATAHTAQIAWTAPSDNESWMIIYHVNDPNDHTPNVEVSAEENPFTLEGLNQSTSYYAYVRAICDDAEANPYQGPVYFTTVSGHQAPSISEVTSTSSSSVTVTWQGVATNVLHDSYELVITTTDEAPASDANVTTTTDLTYTFEGLNASTTYYVWVRDNCGNDGTSDWVSASVTTLPDCPAPTLNAVNASALTANSAYLTYTGNGVSTGYRVYYRIPAYVDLTGCTVEDFEDGAMPAGWTTEGNGTWSVGTGDYSTSTGAASGSYNAKINHGTSGDVTYLVAPAMDLSAESSASVSFSFINRSWSGDTDEFGVCYRIGNGEWTELWSTTSGHSTWTEQTVELMGLAANYQVGFRFTDGYGYGVGLDNIVIGNPVEVPEGAWTLANNTTYESTSTECTITGLDPETTYEAMVVGVCDGPNGENEGEMSNIVTFTTLSLCEVPSNLAMVSTTESSVTFSWEGWQSAFQVRYSTDQENWTEEASNVTSPYTITGLAANTTYYVQVAAAGCENAWSSVLSFATDCAPTQSIPYTYDFEDAAPFNCWTHFDINVIRNNSTNDSHSGSYSMKFAGGLSNLVAMPQFEVDLSALQLKFWVRPESFSNSSCGTFSVGYMTDLEDEDSFVELAQYAYNDWTENTYLMKTVFFPSSTPQGAYIAFRQNDASYWYWFVDDVEVSPTPSCLPVANLVLDEPDAREAMFSWDLVDETQTEWVIQYADNADFDNPEPVEADYNEGFLLEDLQPSTHYWVRVSANCGQESSEWSNVVDFTTLDVCAAPEMDQTVVTGPFEALVAWTGSSDKYNLRYREQGIVTPLFTEDFENETTFANWTVISNNTANTAERSEDAARNGSNGFEFSSYSSATDYNQYLISPELTVSGILEFYYAKDGYSTEKFRVGYSSTTNDITAFTWGDEVSASSYDWNLFSEVMPQGTKYVAINYYSNYLYYLYVDDITIGTPAEWTTVENIQALDYTIQGLTDGTDYEVQVQSVCENEESSTWQWSEVVPFTTSAAYNLYLYEGTGSCETLSMRGDVIELPEATPACQDWMFAGWATEPVYNEEPADLIEPIQERFSYYPLDEDTRLYAVYSTIDNSNNLVYSTFPNCGIYTQLNVTESFESYDNPGTEHRTGVKPTGWAVVDQELPTTWMGRPQVYDFPYYAHEGDNSLLMDSVTLFIMPELDPTITSYDGLKMELFVRQRQASHSLLVGLMSDPADPNTFEVVSTINNSSTACEQNVVDFTGYEQFGRYIAFKNVYDVDNIDHGRKSFNYIDDITLYVVGSSEDDCTIDLSYTQNFDEGLTSGDEPECWRLVRQEVAMPEGQTPHVVTSNNGLYAWSGTNSLYMSLRGVYSMPKMDESVDMSEVQMEFYVKQPNANHQLEVGVMVDPNDYNTYTAVQTFNNTGTAFTRCVVDFSEYTGEGRYIVFRNTLVEGASGLRSYNYIDDVRFVTDDDACAISLSYTQSFEEDPDLVFVGPASESAGLECWTLAHRDVTMSESMLPKIVSYGGSQRLYLTGRGYYAMPKLSVPQDVMMSDIVMDFKLKQHINANMNLEVGFMSDLNDITTYQLVATYNNGNAAWNTIMVDFSEFDTVVAEGKYIVFHNTATSNSSRSYNYIDNINLGTTVLMVATVTTEESEEIDNNEVEIDELVEIANPTGVESYDLDNLTVYPNPTTGMVHINAIDVTRVDVYDQMGKLVSVFEHERDINLGNLNAGVYMLRVTLPEGVAMRKVVKK